MWCFLMPFQTRRTYGKAMEIQPDEPKDDGPLPGSSLSLFKARQTAFHAVANSTCMQIFAVLGFPPEFSDFAHPSVAILKNTIDAWN